MSKLITFFLFMFIGCTMLSAVMEGGGGVITTELTSGIDNDDTILNVSSTTDFLSADSLIIGSEEISYTGITDTTFTGCTRGENGSNASSHSSGSTVYTTGASVVNDALGFNIAATADDMGWWAVITIPFNFMTKTLPNIISMNFSFLTGQLGIIGWFFFAAGAGLVITIALSLAGGRRI